MQQNNTMAPLKIILMLDKLNGAKRLYDNTTNEEEKQQADQLFADCYDWLIEQHVAIHYDKRLYLWFYSNG